MTVILDLILKLYGMTYGLSMTHGKEQADFLSSKATQAIDTLFVEYSTMLGGNIPIPSPTQPFLRIEVVNNHRKRWIKMVEDNPSAHLSSETQSALDCYLMSKREHDAPTFDILT